jgi:fibronectin type 3 domain-containing protein
MKNLFRNFGFAALLAATVLLTAGCPNINDAEDTNTTTKLPAPKNLTATGVSASQISLSWTPVEGANYYSIYRTTDSTWQDYSIISSSVLNTVYSDYGLSPATTYYYKVGAKETYSNDPVGELSEAASAATFASSQNTDPEKLPAPQSLTATGVSASQISLSWTPVEGASYYSIYRTTDSTWQDYSIISSSVSNTVYSDTGLSPATTYYYKVGAKKTYSSDPVGELSEAASAATFASSQNTDPHPAPQNLTATAHGRIITLEWNAVEGAGTYYVYGSFTSGGTFVYIRSIYNGTAFNVISMAEYGSIPLEASTAYYFKVCASGGELSSEVSATTGS